MAIGKRGATADNFFVVVSFFGFAVVLLTAILFWNSLDTISLWTDSSIGPQIKTNAQNAVNTFDFIGLMAYIALHFGIIALAYLLRTHPVMYVGAFLLVAILALIAAPLSNAYEDIIQDTDLSTASTSIPMTNFIMQQLPKFEIIWAFITCIVLYGMARNEGLF